MTWFSILFPRPSPDSEDKKGLKKGGVVVFETYTTQQKLGPGVSQLNTFSAQRTTPSLPGISRSLYREGYSGRGQTKGDCQPDRTKTGKRLEAYHSLASFPRTSLSTVGVASLHQFDGLTQLFFGLSLVTLFLKNPA
jgi:hypothetical protein